jgi:hypothetical protein
MESAPTFFSWLSPCLAESYHAIWALRTIRLARSIPHNFFMRKSIAVALVILAVNVLAAGAWAADRSQRRAKEINALDGGITIKAGGVLNTTINVYDTNDIANAGFDYDLIENHHDALRQLGFTSVHVETAKGQKLDLPL